MTSVGILMHAEQGVPLPCTACVATCLRGGRGAYQVEVPSRSDAAVQLITTPCVAEAPMLGWRLRLAVLEGSLLQCTVGWC